MRDIIKRGATGALAATLFALWAGAAAQAQTLVRSYGATAGTVNGVSIAALNGNHQIVTALVNGAGDLELIVWYNSTVAHTIYRQTSYTGGAVDGNGGYYSHAAYNAQEVAVVAIGLNQVVTALRDSSGYLELITFSVSSSGSITRQGTAYTDGNPNFSQIGALALANVDGQHVVAVTADPNAYTATVSVWLVGSNGSITQNGYPWTLSTGGEAVGVLAVSSSLVVVAQNGGCSPPGPWCDVGIYPLTLTSFSMDYYGNLTELQQLSPPGMVGSGFDLTLQMTALGGGSFALAFIDDTADQFGWSGEGGYLWVSLWQDSYGYLSMSAKAASYWASTAAMANIAGIPFTISDSDSLHYDSRGGIMDAYLQGTAWYGQSNGYYQPAATALDTLIDCYYPFWTSGQPCYASAASLPSGQAATAISDNYGYLHVDVWTFTGPY